MADYCELCELPLSQCVHGQPPPPVPAKAAPAKTGPGTPRTRSTATRAPAAPVRRRWTAPADFKPHICRVLDDAGGELAGDDFFDALERRMDVVLLPGDREAMPQGELRWRFAARRARKELMDEEILVAQAGPGVWRLSSGAQ